MRFELHETVTLPPTQPGRSGLVLAAGRVHSILEDRSLKQYLPAIMQLVELGHARRLDDETSKRRRSRKAKEN